MKKGWKPLLAVWALVGAGLSAVGPVQAMSSFDLPSLYAGNMLGLAYRESDGHFLVSQNADSVPGGWDWGTPMLYELDGSGQLLHTVNLSTVLPDTYFIDAVSAPQSGGDVYAQVYQIFPEAPDAFVPRVVRLSSDLSTYNGALDPGASIGHVTDSEIVSYNYFDDTVSFTSRTTGAVETVNLAGHFGSEIGCSDACIAGVAPSWDGGLFVISDAGDEHDSRSRLMQFDRQGHLLGTMYLDPAVFGYHPLAIDTDVSGQRIFLSMNNLKVFTLSSEEFAAALIPEPATWASMGLGLVLMSLATRRARQGAQNRK